ncbi:uncharacterized protein A4U43_C08F22100 [Asparagus officinalis]|nr:uncharacterized protein A4U43_C08F22100 [Asparagus officinalis]
MAKSLSNPFTYASPARSDSNSVIEIDAEESEMREAPVDRDMWKAKAAVSKQHSVEEAECCRAYDSTTEAYTSFFNHTKPAEEGENQYRLNGQAKEFKQLNIHVWEAFEKGHDKTSRRVEDRRM